MNYSYSSRHTHHLSFSIHCVHTSFLLIFRALIFSSQNGRRHRKNHRFQSPVQEPGIFGRGICAERSWKFQRIVLFWCHEAQYLPACYMAIWRKPAQCKLPTYLRRPSPSSCSYSTWEKSILQLKTLAMCWNLSSNTTLSNSGPWLKHSWRKLWRTQRPTNTTNWRCHSNCPRKFLIKLKP